MKKLTAGIFTVMLGLVAVNANADVTSKRYVDTLVENTADTLTQNITAAKNAADAAQADANTNASDISGLKTRMGTAESDIDALESDMTTAKSDITNLKAADTTMASSISALETKVGDSNVADKISAALRDYSTTTDMESAISTAKTEAIDAAATDATTKVGALANGAVKTNTAAIAAINNEETGILKSAKDYADGLAGNYDANGAASQAETNAKAYTDELAGGQVKTNKEAIAAINNTETGILKSAQNYADGLAGNYDAAGSASTAEENAKAYTDALKNGQVATNVTAISTNASNISDLQNNKQNKLPAPSTNPDCAKAECALVTNNSGELEWQVVVYPTTTTPANNG